MLMKVDDPDVEGEFSYVPYIGTASEDSAGIVTFSSPDMNQIQLAYAITVHKSQGSQYPVIIFPIAGSDRASFVNRNMVYTAISRAQKAVVMVGEVNAVGAGLSSSRLEAEDGSDVFTSTQMFTNANRSA